MPDKQRKFHDYWQLSISHKFDTYEISDRFWLTVLPDDNGPGGMEAVSIIMTDPAPRTTEDVTIEMLTAKFEAFLREQFNVPKPTDGTEALGQV